MLTDAKEFIRVLSGNVDSLVTFQVFYDPKPPHVQRPDLAAEFTNTFDASLNFFNNRQQHHCGIYMCINGTDGKGRNNDNITHLRVCFADFDGTTEPEWAITPHLVQQRDATHGHAFWLIEPGELTQDEWSTLQKQIAMYHGTDQQVIDPARVVRLPSFNHYKDPANPARYSITLNNSDLPKYTPEQLRAACVLDAQKDAELRKWSESRAGLQEGTGYNDNPVYIQRVTNWVSTLAPVAVEGNGTMTLIMVASYAHDHGVPLTTCKQILWDNYNPRCEPPWGDHEKSHFDEVVTRAYKYATSAAGCKTAPAAFNAVPERTDGFIAEPKIVLNNTDNPIADDRIDATAATSLLATLTVKSSHYSFAQCFDGRIYKGAELVRYKKQFYAYNGRCWKVVDDDNIKAQVQRLCCLFKPAESFTNGVFKTLCDLVNTAVVENGAWLDGREDETSNLAVFDNGIVDLNSTDRNVMPHTHEYFTFNEMGYSYNRNATCPTWLTFLDSIFTKDLQLQLQQWFGYCLTNDVSLQKFALFIGESRGGKGVICDVLSKMVGLSNVVSPSLSNLIKDSTLHSMATSSLAIIPDAHDVNINTRDSVLSNFKAITGGDQMHYHVMYKGGQTSYFKTRFVMNTNNMPSFIDSSGALVNRMLVFPFTVTFRGKEDPTLRARLLAEIEGIAQWAVEGLISLRNSGNTFSEAASGKEMKEEIREDMFPLSDFVKSSCTVDESLPFVPMDDIYNAYRLWASSNGITRPMTQLNVSKCLRNSPLTIKHCSNPVRGFTGLSIKPIAAHKNVKPFAPVA